VALELGGKSPNIILEDAELEPAIRDAWQSVPELWADVQRPHRMSYRGHAWRGGAVAAAVAEYFNAGDPFEAARHSGTVSEAQRQLVATTSRRAATGRKAPDRGRRAPEGTRAGTSSSHRLLRVTPEMTIAQRRSSDPCCLMPYEDEDDGCGSPISIYGLAGGLSGQGSGHAKRVPCASHRTG